MAIIHQSPESNERCEASNKLPQETASTGNPMPRKLSVASDAIAEPMLLTMRNAMEEKKLGSKCVFSR